MDNNLNAAIEALKKLNINIRQQLEMAEAYIPTLNAQLAQLGVIDLATGVTILGDVIQDRPYTAGLGQDDSVQLIQAVLLVPEGIGVLLWDMEEFVENQKSPLGGEDQVRLKFVPFGGCSSAVKALLLPQVQPLLERVFAIVGLNQR